MKCPLAGCESHMDSDGGSGKTVQSNISGENLRSHIRATFINLENKHHQLLTNNVLEAGSATGSDPPTPVDPVVTKSGHRTWVCRHVS